MAFVEHLSNICVQSFFSAASSFLHKEISTTVEKSGCFVAEIELCNNCTLRRISGHRVNQSQARKPSFQSLRGYDNLLNIGLPCLSNRYG